jgi:hypothetical protein
VGVIISGQKRADALLMQRERNRAKHGAANKRSLTMVSFSMRFSHRSFMIEANDI